MNVKNQRILTKEIFTSLKPYIKEEDLTQDEVDSIFNNSITPPAPTVVPVGHDVKIYSWIYDSDIEYMSVNGSLKRMTLQDGQEYVLSDIGLVNDHIYIKVYESGGHVISEAEGKFKGLVDNDITYLKFDKTTNRISISMTAKKDGFTSRLIKLNPSSQNVKLNVTQHRRHVADGIPYMMTIGHYGSSYDDGLMWRFIQEDLNSNDYAYHIQGYNSGGYSGIVPNTTVYGRFDNLITEVTVPVIPNVKLGDEIFSNPYMSRQDWKGSDFNTSKKQLTVQVRNGKGRFYKTGLDIPTGKYLVEFLIGLENYHLDNDKEMYLDYGNGNLKILAPNEAGYQCVVIDIPTNTSRLDFYCPSSSTSLDIIEFQMTRILEG